MWFHTPGQHVCFLNDRERFFIYSRCLRCTSFVEGDGLSCRSDGLKVDNAK